MADRHSGHRVGGISPFGTRRPMPVYCAAQVAQRPHIYIKGCKSGWIQRASKARAIRLPLPTLVPKMA